MTEMLLVRIVGILGSIFGGRGKVQYRADSYDAHHQKSPENVWYEKGSYKKIGSVETPMNRGSHPNDENH
jgi:hypothetical protein